MASEPENLTLILLRRVDEKIDGMDRRLDEITTRLASLETHVANQHADYAAQSLRLDRVAEDIRRINRRLELVTAE